MPGAANQGAFQADAIVGITLSCPCRARHPMPRCRNDPLVGQERGWQWCQPCAARQPSRKRCTHKEALVAIAFGLTASLLATGASAQATLTSVKQRGMLVCGASHGLDGFSGPDAKGNWTGLDVDLCRAIAAAIFEDPTKVRFIPLAAAKDRFTALQSGEVDVLARNTTATMARDTQLGVDFPAINYFDGQGFTVRRTLGVSSTKELNGRSVCVQQGTTNELNLADYFRAGGMKGTVLAFATADEARTTYEAGGCEALTSDASALYSWRLMAPVPDDHIVLPEIISKEPLGPAVRHGDNQWGDIVRWVHNAMLNAEELGVTKANVDQMKTSENPEIKRLLGTEGKFGEAVGLPNDWAVRIIKHVGNYGESFDRNVGEGSRLKIKRGQNAQWTKGGLQYGIPVR
jgi:general L-amino acid transport system substrate-binding protein